MSYTLKGKIARANPYQLDTTLTVEGAGAEAEATGKAIAAARKVAEDHVNDKENPHKVSKTQVGLGNVDNTSDKDKPISDLQAEAIADAKKAGTEAQNAADNAQTAADNAQTAADNAQTAADNAQTTADQKTSKSNITVILSMNGWAENKQTVNAEGVTNDNDVFITAAPDSYIVYAESMIHCSEQGKGTLTFTCNKVPESDVNVNVIIFT